MESVQDSFAVLPNVIALLLVVTVFAVRTGRNMVCRTLVLLCALILSWFVQETWVIALLPIFMFAGMAIDRRREPKIVHAPRALSAILAVLSAVVLVVQAYYLLSTRSGPTVLRVTKEELIENRGPRYQAVLPRSSLRIVEFKKVPHRTWHLKDGTHVVALFEGDEFVDANGERWLARGIVSDPERWAGIQREQVNRDP